MPPAIKQPTQLRSETLRAILRFKQAFISNDIAAMAEHIDAIPMNVLFASDYESLFPIIVASQTNSTIKAALLHKVLTKLCAIPGWDNLELKVGADYYWFRFDAGCVNIALDILGSHSIQLGARLAKLRRLHPANTVFDDCLRRYKKVLVETSKFKGRGSVYTVTEVTNAWDYMAMGSWGACLFYDKMSDKQARALVEDFVTVDDFTRRHWGLDHSAIDVAAAEMNGNMLLRAMQFMRANGVNDAKYVNSFAMALRAFVAAQKYDFVFHGHDSPQKFKAAKIQDMLDYLQGFWFSTFETNLYDVVRNAVAEQLKTEPSLLTEINIAKHKIATRISKDENDSEVVCKPMWFSYRPTAVMPG